MPKCTVLFLHFSPSIGTTTRVDFGLLNCRLAFSAGRFYRVPLPAARQTPNLKDFFSPEKSDGFGRV
jgi:hypothetical protein